MQSALEITTGFNPLAFMLYLIQPKIEVNGQARSVPWGKQLGYFPPGRYHIRVWFPWMFGPANVARIEVDLPPGAIVSLTYETAFFVFQEGTIRQVGVRPIGT
jgi:hypothetical protein